MKKKKNTKRIVAIILVLAIIAGAAVFFATRDDSADEIVLAEIPIITFFGITDEKTTELGIMQVERDLNNVLITEGYAVKLFLAPEDRFDTMLSSAMEMMDKYMENNKKKGEEKYGFTYTFDYKTSTFTYECEKDTVTPSVVYNQDTIIEMLDDEKEIYPNVPSIDVVLMNDYDKYYELAATGAFERLNGSLEDAAKAIKQSVPAAFLEAVTIGKDIFGIPSVQLVGEYEYLVYDQDMLNKYGVSSKQLLSLEDLESYLLTVDADEENTAAPLLNAPVSSPFELFDGKSLLVDAENALQFVYENDKFTEFYATVARYRSLGLMGDPDSDITTDDFAVAFFQGTEEEVKALSEKTGKNLSYNVFSKPIATSEEVGKSIFCVCSSKKYSVSDVKHGIDFVTLLNRPVSQTDIKNTLLYGALGLTYVVSDIDGTVTIAETEEGTEDTTYLMNNLYTGHTLHALNYAPYGISDEWKEMVRNHNSDLTVSKLSGFKFAPKQYNFKLSNGESIRPEGPDYLAIIDEICKAEYADYINGVSCAVDMEEFNSTVDEKIRERVKAAITAEFETLKTDELNAKYDAEVRADEAFISDKRTNAETTAVALLKEEVTNTLKSEFKALYATLGVTDATEIENRLATDVTTEVIDERYAKDYTEEDIAKKVEEVLDSSVSAEVISRVTAYKQTEEYLAIVTAYEASAEYATAVDARFSETRDTEYTTMLNLEISNNISNFSEELKGKIETAYEEAAKAFIDSQKDKVSAAELEEATVYTTFDDVMTYMFRNQYYAVKGEPKA